MRRELQSFDLKCIFSHTLVMLAQTSTAKESGIKAWVPSKHFCCFVLVYSVRAGTVSVLFTSAFSRPRPGKQGYSCEYRKVL